MNKSGFTLAELLAVIVILGLLAVIVIPIVTETLNAYRTRVCETQVKNVIEAARAWGSEEENLVKLPLDDTETRTITLAELQEAGYIEKDIKNPLDNSIDLEMDITISKKGHRYVYESDFECD